MASQHSPTAAPTKEQQLQTCFSIISPKGPLLKHGVFKCWAYLAIFTFSLMEFLYPLADVFLEDQLDFQLQLR